MIGDGVGRSLQCFSCCVVQRGGAGMVTLSFESRGRDNGKLLIVSGHLSLDREEVLGNANPK